MLQYLIGMFKSIRIIDFIDIAIIAILIYLVLLWIKKARARFILMGMVIIGLIYVLARAFSLYMTTMFFQGFFAILLIMVVIIFQDEFRYFFERVAVLGMQRRRRGVTYGQDIEILSSAIANLSRKQIGALIAIRGQDPLDRHLEAGIRLDGLLSQVLLESIFDPHVPSHDGALVLDNGRVVRFGCYLPLSTNVNEIRRSGTRHAAALGLVERSDALCIVISEERGTISVAEAGRIRELSDPAQLNSILDEFYRRRHPQKGFTVFDFLAGHLLEKALAIILAAAIWAVFGYQKDIIRRDFVIPVEYRNLSPERMIAEPKPKEVTITLNGAERAFNMVDSKELKLSLDMSKVNDGENEIMLNKEMVRFPAGFSVLNIAPDEIKLKIERMITVTVPVEIKTQGALPAGLSLLQLRAEPKEIQVVVPSTLAPDKISITTDIIDLKTISATTTLTPKLVVPPQVTFAGNKYPEFKVVIEVENKEK